MLRNATYHRENSGKHLDHLALIGDLVVPVKQHTRLANHQHEVGLRVSLAQAVVGTCAEYEPVLGLLISVAGDPSLGLERVWVGVCFRVVKCRVGGRNDHGALGNGVFRCYREVLLSQVRNHDDWGTVAESLLDDSAGPLQLLDGVKRKSTVDVAISGLDVLLADLLEVLRAVSHDLEEPCGGRRGSVLGSEEEGEDGHGDLKIAEPADDSRGLLGVIDLLASFNPLAVLLRLDHVVYPEVENALLLATSSHADLALCGTLGELIQDHVSALLSVPGLGEGDNDREVDKLERSGDQVVVVGDLLDGLVRGVVTNEGTATQRSDHEAELLHPRNVLALVLYLRKLHKALEVCVVDFLLAR